MKKDVTVAVIVGFILGAVVAITFVNLPKLLKKGSDVAQNVSFPSITPTITTTISPSENLIIDEPSDESIVAKNSVNIVGKTKANNTIVAVSEVDGIIKTASDDGSFSFPFKLSEGGNKIYIATYDKNGTSETKILTLFYTVEEL